MRLSRWTIAAPVRQSGAVLLVQPLTRQAALVSAGEAAALHKLPESAAAGLTLPLAELAQAGFLVADDEEDAAQCARAYADYCASQVNGDTQLFVVPTFQCNLRCSYCYQQSFARRADGLISAAVVDAFIDYIRRYHMEAEAKPYVTLFGGEPCLDGKAYRQRVKQILHGVWASGLEMAVVTNGYDLVSYLPLLTAGPVREVQVTLDGPRAVHDRRRPHVAGGGSYERIMEGIKALLAATIPVNLRIVVDGENMGSLPQLAQELEQRGWLGLPPHLFKTQIGRNYELFSGALGSEGGAQCGASHLLDRLTLWQNYSDLAQKHPVLKRLHQPYFHGIGQLYASGELPPANFDACPATKKEWAFGPDGGIYGCTATVGHPNFILGTYAPTVTLDETAVAKWRGRNVFSIPECQECSLAPLCGGGCGALAAGRDGSISAPDCRPVRELLGLGAKYYGFS